jgi:hypothetical protein
METIEYIENYITISLPKILEKLSEEEFHTILDKRDCDTFSEQWMQVYNIIEQLKKQKNIPATYNENIRKKAFCIVFDITNNDDLAAYISDDLGLIIDAIKVGANNYLINALWLSYKNGVIPTQI